MKTYTIKEKCSRCPRVLEERDATLDEVMEASDHDEKVTFTVQFPDGTTELRYGALCDTCNEHVAKTLRDLFSPIETVSAKRARKRKKGAEDGEEVDIDLDPTGS